MNQESLQFGFQNRQALSSVNIAQGQSVIGENIYDPSRVAEEEEEDGWQGRPEKGQGPLMR